MSIIKPDPKRLQEAFSQAYKEFGFKATTLFEEGLRKTIDWHREMSNVKT